MLVYQRVGLRNKPCLVTTTHRQFDIAMKYNFSPEIVKWQTKMLATNPLGSTSYKICIPKMRGDLPRQTKNGEVVLFGNSARLSIKRRSKVRDKSLNCLQLLFFITRLFDVGMEELENSKGLKNHNHRGLTISQKTTFRGWYQCPVKLQCFNIHPN